LLLLKKKFIIQMIRPTKSQGRKNRGRIKGRGRGRQG
jgi:hypothetical protein